MTRLNNNLFITQTTSARMATMMLDRLFRTHYIRTEIGTSREIL